jgi:hypothetical protein
MSCKDCNDNCRQGRNCPNRQYVDLDKVKYSLINLYYRFTEKFTVMEWLAWLAAGLYVLSLVT